MSTYPPGASAEDIALDKQVLRSKIRPQRLIARSQRGPAGNAAMAQAFSTHLANLFAPYSPTASAEDLQGVTIAAYLPTPAEPPITPALAAAHRAGARILVPVVKPGRKLAWVVWDPEVDHPLNGMGIAEPEGEQYGPEAFIEANLRLVPALAYSRAGRRLGQGGGYYDRLLPQLSESALTEHSVGIIFAEEILEAIPYDSWDARLERVLSQEGIHISGS